MRKLVLFGLLALALGTSLFLEHRLTSARSATGSAAPGDDTLELLIGTDLSARPPPPEAKPAAPATARSATPAPSVAKNDRAENHRSENHRLEAGETLESLCKARYGSELYAEHLAALNGMSSPAAAKAGQVLEMPEAGKLEKRYRVKKDDTLSDIAKRLLGQTKFADQLAGWNKLENKNQLRENQILRIPD